MKNIVNSLPEFLQLIEDRLVLLRTVAESLEFSNLALAQNDVEAIARGAAHQAELCRQWSFLEDKLRVEAGRRATRRARGVSTVSPAQSVAAAGPQAEWETLRARIAYLTRMHCSLLRHLERSLAVLQRVVDGCAPTYRPDARTLRTGQQLQIGG